MKTNINHFQITPSRQTELVEERVKNTTMKTLLLLFCALFSSLVYGQTPTIHSVDAGGNGQYTTISAAVSAAAEEDVIEINSGIYSENVDAGTKQLYYIAQDELASVIVSASTFKVAIGSVVRGITFSSGNSFEVNSEGSARSADVTLLEGCRFWNVYGRAYSNIKFIGNTVVGSTFFYEEALNQMHNNTTAGVYIYDQIISTTANEKSVYVSKNKMTTLIIKGGSRVEALSLNIFSNEMEEFYFIPDQNVSLSNIKIVGNSIGRVRSTALYSMSNIDLIANKIGRYKSSQVDGISLSFAHRTPNLSIRICNNLIDSCAVGINIVFGTSNTNLKQTLLIENNVISRATHPIQLDAYLGNTTLAANHNIFTECTGAISYRNNATYYTNNCFFNAGAIPEGSGNFEADPKFADPTWRFSLAGRFSMYRCRLQYGLLHRPGPHCWRSGHLWRPIQHGKLRGSRCSRHPIADGSD